MDIASLYATFKDSSGICTDTRKITKGCLFFALKGDNFNGNIFAKKAIDLGAKYAIIDEPQYEASHTILVEDVLHYLQELAKYHRSQLKIPVIGLTGSNGKTTTKELIHAVLSTHYNTTATVGNLNNHIGVPLTLLSIKQSHQIAIVEMGANHLKEIELLSSIAQPDWGYITNFGKAHLEGFGGVEGVIKGKSELYQYIEQNKKGVFINSDDTLQVDLTKNINRKVSFGTGSQSNYTIEKNTAYSNFESCLYQGTLIQSNLTGAYNFSNLCAAVAIGLHFKIPIDKIKEGIENYIPTNNRSQITKTAKNTLIVDAYNANPSSMQAALSNFENLKTSHKWVILGDMFELGTYEAEEHQKIADNLQHKFEKVILVGEAFSKVKAAEAEIYPNTQLLIESLPKKNIEGKTILIKGSRGMKLESLIPLL